MKLKKKRRTGRYRGSRMYGYAAKKHKGKGNVGGKGMSGTGKRGDQKKTFVLKYMFPYFGKTGMKRKSKKLKEVNIEDLNKMYEKNKNKEIILKGYKILGQGTLKHALTVKANRFSEQAKEKIEKAGGKVLSFKTEVKVVEKEKSANKKV